MGAFCILKTIWRCILTYQTKRIETYNSNWHYFVKIHRTEALWYLWEIYKEESHHTLSVLGTYAGHAKSFAMSVMIKWTIMKMHSYLSILRTMLLKLSYWIMMQDFFMCVVLFNHELYCSPTWLWGSPPSTWGWIFFFIVSQETYMVGQKIS